MSPITRKNWGALLKIVWLQVTLFQLRRQKGILLINDGGKKRGTNEGKIQLYCQPQKLDCLPENSFFVSKQSVSNGWALEWSKQTLATCLVTKSSTPLAQYSLTIWKVHIWQCIILRMDTKTNTDPHWHTLIWTKSSLIGFPMRKPQIWGSWGILNARQFLTFSNHVLSVHLDDLFPPALTQKSSVQSLNIISGKNFKPSLT